MAPFTPYCGHAPLPGAEAWNFDPPLLVGLLAVLAIYLVVAIRASLLARRIECFLLGWTIVALAFTSPLCNLSVALFSARVTQHMLIVLLASPLLAAGLAPLTGTSSPRLLWIGSTALLVAMWVWHSPLAYDLTLRNNAVYWSMHITTIGAALALWLGLLAADGAQAFLTASATGLQMSLLGAILTFAERPLFEAHALTTTPWGLSQIDDQRLGGLIMWVPAGLLLTLYAVVALGFALRRMDTPAKAAKSPQYAV